MIKRNKKLYVITGYFMKILMRLLLSRRDDDGFCRLNGTKFEKSFEKIVKILESHEKFIKFKNLLKNFKIF